MFALCMVIGHWYLSLFCQTFFLHRYASHNMFTLNSFWERFFYGLTAITQGSSYLNPKAYAVMHKLHHRHSDTEKDPHSPVRSKSVWSMMKKTYTRYMNFLDGEVPREIDVSRVPEIKWIDKIADSWITRIAWGSFYFFLYVGFASHWWEMLLVPMHWLMGPIQGAIVNWCGHKYGYRNYGLTDHSRNVLLWDLALMGELYQNNHHKKPMRTNFAHKWYEIDPVAPMIWVMSKLGILKIRRKASLASDNTSPHLNHA